MTTTASSRDGLRRATTGTGATLALAAISVTATGTTAAVADDSYSVRPGDTVSHIAARTGVPAASIVRANALADPSRILVGQVLRIPRGGSADAGHVTAQAAPAERSQPSRYTVRSGDTVSALAARWDTTVGAVVRANRLGPTALIRVGQTLTIPGSTPAAPQRRTATHLVRAGDTVSAIAAKHGVKVATVVAANRLRPDALIRVGQELRIPGSKAPAATPDRTPSTDSGTSTRRHTVRSGETVGGLASRYGTTVAAIVKANRLGDASLIRIGQSLAIPGASGGGGGERLVGDTFAGRTYARDVVDAANANKRALLATGVPSRTQMQAKVIDAARRYGVDPALAQAVAYQESGFNHTSVSPANAIGTMQVIPTSGDWASALVGRDLDLLDPDDNVTAGVVILRALLRSAPDLPSAIAGYYQGAASVRKHGMFSDTRRYVASVQTLMTRFA